MSALHVFDMDGTLLRDTTASLEISRHLDHVDDLTDLEHRFATGEITAADFAVAIHQLWAELTDQTVADIAARTPWIDGIDEVCADITAHGRDTDADHHVAGVLRSDPSPPAGTRLGASPSWARVVGQQNGLTTTRRAPPPPSRPPSPATR